MVFEQQILNGLALSGLYITFAVGITLVYGILRIIHLAHGTMILTGAYSTYLLLPFFGDNLVITSLIGMLVSGALGAALGLAVYVPLLKKGQFNAALLASLGILIASQEGLMFTFGAMHMKYDIPVSSYTINFFGVTIFVIQLIAATVSFASMALLWIFLAKTNEGRALRAVDQDRQLASLQGINSFKIYAIALFISSLLGGLSGSLLSLYYNDVHPTIAFYPTLVAMCITIVGGLGSIAGTVVAGVIMALLETFAIAYIPLEFPRTFVSFALLLVILLIKPGGILGKGRK